jgi:hypothetical protein
METIRAFRHCDMVEADLPVDVEMTTDMARDVLNAIRVSTAQTGNTADFEQELSRAMASC